MRDEVRQVSPSGGAKGSKGTALLNIPADFMLALAEHYGDGAEKYPSDPDGMPNFWKGYPMSLNIEALHRHWFAWLGGERNIPEDPDDPTSGNHHLLAVVWHCIDLWRKEMMHPESTSEWDDRPCTAVARRAHVGYDPEPVDDEPEGAGEDVFERAMRAKHPRLHTGYLGGPIG